MSEISSNLKTQSALQESESKFRALVEASSLGVMIADSTGTIVLVNAALEAMFGYNRIELVGQSLHILLPKRFHDTHPHYYRRYFTEPRGRPMGIGRELAGRRRDGTEFPVEVGLSYVHTDEGMLALAHVTDITARKQAEAQIQRHVRHLQVLNEAARIFAEMTTDYQRLLADVAQKTAELLQDTCVIRLLSEDNQWLELTVYHDSDPKVLALVRDVLSISPVPLDKTRITAHVLQSGKPLLIPSLSTADASQTVQPFHILLEQVHIKSLIVAPIHGQGGPVGLLYLARHLPGNPSYTEEDLFLAEDLANRVALAVNNAQLYQQVQQATADLEKRVAARTAQLEAANKELEAFSYSVSHDLRAPVRALHGFSRILLDDYGAELPDPVLRYLKRIHGNAQQMGELIDGLLAFSRLGREALHKRPVKPVELAHQVYTNLALSIGNRQVNLSIAPMPPCQADPVLLRQVYENLLHNALKYTVPRDPAIIEVGAQNENGRTVYFVRDNGVGFDMKYAGKLFGVFQRLHPADVYEGTGVGLALVQRIIHRHGGEIWADAQVDKGATFYFTLEDST